VHARPFQVSDLVLKRTQATQNVNKLSQIGRDHIALVKLSKRELIDRRHLIEVLYPELGMLIIFSFITVKKLVFSFLFKLMLHKCLISVIFHIKI